MAWWTKISGVKTARSSYAPVGPRPEDEGPRDFRYRFAPGEARYRAGALVQIGYSPPGKALVGGTPQFQTVVGIRVPKGQRVGRVYPGLKDGAGNGPFDAFPAAF